MHVRKPSCSPLSGWVVVITKDVTPLSEIIETISCSSKEQAWQVYREAMVESGKMI